MNGVWKIALGSVLASWTFASGVAAQGGFVYTNDDVVPNTVSGFAAAANGVLAPLPGSPFSTGGSGTAIGFFAAHRIVAVGTFLYAANDGSADVSGFAIHPVTGVLTPVPGSPFAAAGSGVDISLAGSPGGRFLMAGFGAVVNVYAVAADGALTPIAGSPFPLPGPANGMKVSPDGQFLAVGLNGAVAVLAIAADGSLSPVPGSPFPDGGPGFAAGVDLDCRSALLFAGEANAAATIVDVFDVAANGALAPIAGSPFVVAAGSNSNVPLLSPDDRHLFVSNQVSATVTVFDVAAGGGLTTVAGSPFAVGGGASLTSGLATDRAGSLLYAANAPNLVAVFTIAPSGALTPAPGSPVSTGRPPGLLSLTAFPAKVCFVPADIDIKFCSDPNAFNCKQRGKTPATLFGSAALDVAAIDVSTLRLCLASDTSQCTGPPRSWSIADRGDPLTDLGADRCAVAGGAKRDFRSPDGFPDLDAAFDSREVAALVGCTGLSKGDLSPILVILGALGDGTPFASRPLGDPGVDRLVIKN